jgi:hypothetical protein
VESQAEVPMEILPQLSQEAGMVTSPPTEQQGITGPAALLSDPKNSVGALKEAN